MIEIHDITNSVFASKTYILSKEGEDKAWLVDIGDMEPVLALLPEGANVRGVFITHSHVDHIYGINALTERFPDGVVYCSEHGREGLYSDKLNFSRYHGDILVYQGENVRVLQEGSRVELWPGSTMEVIETPGHDWSCLTYLTENAVFCGDSYLPAVEVFAKFPKSNPELAKQSENRILALSRGRTVYPGHGGAP